ncbi:MAG: hypothetical protein HYZ50_14890 [Deltaproteobacteria bacterium]|nr:hypothetical protein [Deltaproteobacteria bacterium]
MNILDEDISAVERERLRAGKFRVRQIGIEVGRLGMKDRSDIIPLLHTLRSSTFFTRDHGFYHPRLLHPGYCLVHLDVAFNEVAEYIRRFLRHPEVRTQAQRMGKVVRVRHSGINYWQVRQKGEQSLDWR